MDILGNITWFFMTLTALVIFLMVMVVGIAVLDYALDSDIKGALVKWLGPRHFLLPFKLKFLEIAKKVDTPSRKDIWSEDAKVLYETNDYDAEIEEIKRRMKEAEKEQNV